jgi:hypothetical protein
MNPILLGVLQKEGNREGDNDKSKNETQVHGSLGDDEVVSVFWINYYTLLCHVRTA